MIAVKTADVTQDFKMIADRVTRGERVLISRPRNENIVMITETEYNELKKIRENKTKKNLKEVFAQAREEAVANGTSDMSMDEIDDIIAEVRREKREKSRAEI